MPFLCLINILVVRLKLTFGRSLSGSHWVGQNVGLMKHNESDGSPTMGESELAARKLAAQIQGRLGGKAGRGAAKRRSSEHCRAAVNKLWEAYRARKAAESGSKPA